MATTKNRQRRGYRRIVTLLVYLIIVPTVLALVLSLAAVNMVTPRYKSEARILVDGRENVFLRPNGERNEERNTVDAEAVTSQVQLLLSRDLARENGCTRPLVRSAGVSPSWPS